VLHLGPYAVERPTIERLHRFIEESGYERAGKHHEIYLSIPGRGDPAKMRTGYTAAGAQGARVP